MTLQEDRRLQNSAFSFFPLQDVAATKQKILHWASQFSTFSFLDNNQYNLPHHQYECVVGVGVVEQLTASAGSAFEQLQDFYAKEKRWLFGHFSYDLNSELAPLASGQTPPISFPDVHFFSPEILIILSKKEVAICSTTKLNDAIWQAIQQQPIAKNDEDYAGISIQSQFSQTDYIDTVKQLQRHIQKGNCYEINFCQAFFANNVRLQPARMFEALCQESANPFAALYRVENNYLICASPERYLQKKGDKILSQPIKGTWKRHLQNFEEDEVQKKLFQQNAKERSENVMVVDLVRNDLSKVCQSGSVVVDELYGVYTFPQVHQMVSTISGLLQPRFNWIDAVKASFPMGSMTGAPKQAAMQLIEKYEKTKRGIFSGAVGYVTPDGDVDFNVVIRSILYNQPQQYLSYLVGAGITFYSDAAQEYEECMLKAAAIKKVLEKR
jgi:para-aminobenzoate synthetase component I